MGDFLHTFVTKLSAHDWTAKESFHIMYFPHRAGTTPTTVRHCVFVNTFWEYLLVFWLQPWLKTKSKIYLILRRFQIKILSLNLGSRGNFLFSRRFCCDSKLGWKRNDYTEWLMKKTKKNFAAWRFCSWEKSAVGGVFSSHQVIVKTRPNFFIQNDRIHGFELDFKVPYSPMEYYHYCRRLPTATGRVSPRRICSDTRACNQLFYSPRSGSLLSASIHLLPAALLSRFRNI